MHLALCSCVLFSATLRRAESCAQRPAAIVVAARPLTSRFGDPLPLPVVQKPSCSVVSRAGRRPALCLVRVHQEASDSIVALNDVVGNSDPPRLSGSPSIAAQLGASYRIQTMHTATEGGAQESAADQCGVWHRSGIFAKDKQRRVSPPSDQTVLCELQGVVPRQEVERLSAFSQGTNTPLCLRTQITLQSVIITFLSPTCMLGVNSLRRSMAPR